MRSLSAEALDRKAYMVMSKISGMGIEEQWSSELMLLEQEIWVGKDTISEMLIETSKETVLSAWEEKDGKESKFVDEVAMVEV